MFNSQKLLQYEQIKFLLGILPALFFPLAGIVMTDAPFIWPVSTLIYNIGLFYCLTLASNKLIKIFFFNIIAAILFVIESSFFISYYLQNTGFNDAFFYHLRPDLIYAGLQEFVPIILLVIVSMLGFMGVSTYFLAKDTSKRSWGYLIAPTLFFLGLFISPPARAIVGYTETHVVPNNTDFFANFSEMKNSDVSIESVKPKHPNIVLIYAESIDQRYFDENVFPELLPNLNRLREDSINFSNVSQGIGAEWTIAGMVASQCGYPLVQSLNVGNNEFSMFDNFLPRATCLGDLLRKNGYHLAFIGGADERFAGKGNFLRSHGYSEIIDRDELLTSILDKSYFNFWGAFDNTLFDSAIQKFESLSKEKSPFLLTLLTIDTHQPDGYRSKTCDVYMAGDNSMLNSVHCSDQLIAKFIEQIRKSPFSDDTLVIVLSDHLALSNKASALLESSHMPKRLTFFVNTPEGIKGEIINPGLHYDIGPTILDLAGFRIIGRMGFGAPLTQGKGYLPGKFGEEKWQEERENLMGIGSTLWDTEVTLEERGIKFNLADFSLTMGGRQFNLRSFGFLEIISSTLFLFDDNSLSLKKIDTYPFDGGLKRETLSRSLLQHNKELALVISKAKNLPGFVDPSIQPERLVFFFGKPGGGSFISGPITAELTIPYDMIRNLRQTRISDRIVREREDVLTTLERENIAKVGK